MGSTRLPCQTAKGAIRGGLRTLAFQALHLCDAQYAAVFASLSVFLLTRGTSGLGPAGGFGAVRGCVRLAFCLSAHQGDVRFRACWEGWGA